jgi:lysophospholipase L1-like esterase
MKAFFSILLTVTALASCAKKGNDLSALSNGYKVKAPSATNDSLAYLALGDSYTIGQSVPLVQSFPYQLAAQLNLQLKVSNPTIIATTGWNTLDLINAINSSGTSTRPYDFTTLLIGVNDQFQGIDPNSYKTTFTNVLNMAIHFVHGNKNRVFVLSIPDYSVTPFAAGQDRAAIATQIDQFNAINKSISVAAGVNYLDITDISRQAATDATLIAPDGLHPSGKMYSLWVQRLAPMVKAQLDK